MLFVRALQASLAQETQVLGIEEIMKVLPHRYPFLLVDRILEMEPKKRVVGIKNVTINEPFFQGHFPGHPIMPGVLIVEAMAQVGGMLLHRHRCPTRRSKVVYFMSLNNVKFRRPVKPGDQLRFELEMLQMRGPDVQDAGRREGGRRGGVRGGDGRDGARPMTRTARIHAATRAFVQRHRDPARRSATDVEIGPFAIVGEECTIGDGCVIAPRATLERNVQPRPRT